MDSNKSAIETLQTLTSALGAGLAVWGVNNLIEGYRTDNQSQKSQGMKQIIAGKNISALDVFEAVNGYN